ncbi:MAG: hypothetical protein D6729_03010 [Deltaproteobacteria bacterium]|nr:MAG: hypothetical protein D6729_03010 [Deltaproteobacteria bacterium]
MTLWRGAACLLLAGALSSPAAAFVRSKVPFSDACLWWGEREISYRIHQAGSDDLQDGSDVLAVRQSFQAWSEVECSDVHFVYRGLVSRGTVGYREGDPENTNLVVWRERACSNVAPAQDPCWLCLTTGGECCGSKYDCWEHPSGVIAVTTTTFDSVTGELNDADIELNGAEFWFTTRDAPACDDPEVPPVCTGDADCAAGTRCFRGACLEDGCVRTDVANTVTHEVGHVLGLDHSTVPGATMFASAEAGELDKRTLEEDDREGLCTIYPVGGPTLTCFGQSLSYRLIQSDLDSRGCLGCGSGGGPAGGLPLALVVLFFWVWRRR